MTRRLSWPTVSLALALAGVAVAGYLTFVHYDKEALVCGIGDCATVQNSKYAEIGGIPIAILGLGMYLGVIGLGILRRVRHDWFSTATMGVFAIVLAGTMYAAYLTYLEIAVIKAICQWCVVSALLTVGILVVEGTGLYRTLNRETAEAFD